MEDVHHVLSRGQWNSKATLCAGCPNRETCKKGYGEGYMVHSCTIPVAKDYALAVCGPVVEALRGKQS